MGRSIVDSALVWHSTKPAHDVLPVSSRRLDRRLFLSTHERASEKSCDDFSSNHSLWHGCMIPKSMATLNRFQIVKITDSMFPKWPRLLSHIRRSSWRASQLKMDFTKKPLPGQQKCLLFPMKRERILKNPFRKSIFPKNLESFALTSFPCEWILDRPVQFSNRFEIWGAAL